MQSSLSDSAKGDAAETANAGEIAEAMAERDAARAIAARHAEEVDALRRDALSKDARIEELKQQVLKYRVGCDEAFQNLRALQGLCSSLGTPGGLLGDELHRPPTPP